MTDTEQTETASAPPDKFARKLAATERRNKAREIARRVAKMSDDERAALAARSLVTTIEGRTLSLHNQCLMALQRPGATLVGGFRQWLKHGRAVRKGEHGAVIWVPIGNKRADANGDTETTERTGFILASVFDVSQTQELETAVAA